MATETVPRLPAINCKTVQVTRQFIETDPGRRGLPVRGSQDKDDDAVDVARRATSFLARVELGSVRKQPRPGDVYRPHTSSGLGYFTAKQQRPLGLIPDRRERMTLRTELTRLFTPVPSLHAPSTAPPLSMSKQALPDLSEPIGAQSGVLQTVPAVLMDEHKTRDRAERNSPVATAVKNIYQEKEGTQKQKNIVVSNVGPSASTILLGVDSLPPYCLHQYGMETLKQFDYVDNDLGYVEMFANYNIKDYYGTLESPRVYRLPHKLENKGARKGSHWSSSPRMTTLLQLSHSKKAAHLSERIDFRSSTVKYVKFSGQAKLWNKHLTDDRRDALDYEPCERCRLRGGRCSKCKAIRTGGGYIILDNLSDVDLQGRYGNGYGLDNEYCYGHGTDGRGGLNRYGQNGDQHGAGMAGRGLLTDSYDDDHWRKFGDVGHAGGLGDGWGFQGGSGGGKGSGDGDGRGGRLGSNQTGKSGLGNSLDGDGNNLGSRDNDSGTGLGLDGKGDGTAQNGDQDDGRLGSRQSGSRPASTLGSQPASSLRSRKDRLRRNLGVEKGQRGGGSGEDSDDGGGSDGEGGRRRSRRRRGNGDDSDDDGEGKDRANYKFSSERREGDDEEDGGSYANLMRFKRKRDDVKALHATLKELQGIDPLDYLAKYCIIDQSKLPHYQHAYDNVDRDEDDEIDITELDFALKTVNYNLITDAEMNYVHSVLELAGRYKLNFRFFSLIAALSEKVVALEDMVKRLINKMDFEALEVKMKKCKELFYLLADNESSDHEGGVVTTNSLAVELQAGGLTAEHVKFVVDRLNHEDKGIVEFLDYLTYVPLFVEIHDTISGNPLDFSRTK